MSYFNSQSRRQMVLGMNFIGLVHLWLICLYPLWCFRSWNSQCLYRGRHVRHSVTKKSKYQGRSCFLVPENDIKKVNLRYLIFISTAHWLLFELNSLGFSIFSRKKLANLKCDRKKNWGPENTVIVLEKECNLLRIWRLILVFAFDRLRQRKTS